MNESIKINESKIINEIEKKNGLTRINEPTKKNDPSIINKVATINDFEWDMNESKLDKNESKLDKNESKWDKNESKWDKNKFECARLTEFQWLEKIHTNNKSKYGIDLDTELCPIINSYNKVKRTNLLDEINIMEKSNSRHILNPTENNDFKSKLSEIDKEIFFYLNESNSRHILHPTENINLNP